VVGGDVRIGCAATTIEQSGGEVLTYGSGAITTINVDGGTFIGRSTGTITTLRVGNGGAADFSTDPRSKTITNATITSGGVVDLNNGNPQSITVTNGVDLSRCNLDEATIRVWSNTTLSLSAV